ncbi:MAG: DNA alkylation repair protein [Syntrophales bacterium LBB04]|nr:DNA alkylation repair protein [Syntrophales bacterium LBB04]
MSKISVQSILSRIKDLGDPQRARNLQWFFKTGVGEYGEGDVFAGLRVPEIRKLAKEYRSLSLFTALQLLRSPLHEARLLALLLMVRSYQQGDIFIKEKIYHAYLKHTRLINNWDLVDLSAEHIVGDYLDIERSEAPIQALASSKLIWDRRIAIMATFHFIKKGRFDATLSMAQRLLQDPEDLIHKAVGWMLREIGKRDQPVEESFLQVYYKTMPRTMLRYAIEKFPEDLRQKYLKGKI